MMISFRNDLEYVVLFVHHKNDYVTKKHLKQLRLFADNVIPLCCNDGLCFDPIPEAHVVKQNWQRKNWYNIDLIIREWYKSSQVVRAKRYIVIDWDCFVNERVEEIYSSCWDCDLGSVRFADQLEKPDWPHWCDLERLPKEMINYAIYSSPFNGLLISNRALKSYSEYEVIEGVFSELRLPTVIFSMGFDLKTIKPFKGKNVFSSYDVKITGKGLFHPIKKIKKNKIKLM